MKPASLITILLLHALFSFGQIKTYKWTQVLPEGNGSFPENWKLGKYPMGIIPIVAFDNDLYMVGQKKVWVSKDGINWIVHSKTDWGERHGMTITYFNEMLWMTGGMKSWDKFYNDIWYSKDGKSWKQVKLHADWSERRGHSIVVFKNKMWLFGGSVSTGQPNLPPTQSLNDIWSSSDGINWINISLQSKWSAREPRVVTFNEKLFLVGDVDKNDIWHSTNGKEWIIITENAEWERRQNYGLLAFDEKLWVFGGRGLNDVWLSKDGKNWSKQISKAPWSTRTAQHSVIYLNKLWIYSGKTGRSDSWAGDIWAMTNSL